VVPQLSIQIPNFAPEARDWTPVLDLARDADVAGVDRLVVSDHVLLGERLDAYGDPTLGGTSGGRQPTGPEGQWLEPLTLLSVVAATTTRVRLGTAVLLAALRPPPVLAKQVATLDVLSGGRLDLGVGVGWQREEYDACGLDFVRRGELLDRCLGLCQRLWSGSAVDHDDGVLVFERVHSNPVPLQPGGVPIWVSGRATPRTARRVARFGAGWIPWGEDIAEPAPGIEMMRSALQEVGRDPAHLQVQGTLPVVRREGAFDMDATMAALQALVPVGVTDFRFHHRWCVDRSAEAALLAEVVESFRSAAGRTS